MWIDSRCQDVNQARINLHISRSGLHDGLLHVQIHVQHEHGRSNSSGAEVWIETGRIRAIRPARIASIVISPERQEAKIAVGDRVAAKEIWTADASAVPKHKRRIVIERRGPAARTTVPTSIIESTARHALRRHA